MIVPHPRWSDTLRCHEQRIHTSFLPRLTTSLNPPPPPSLTSSAPAPTMEWAYQLMYLSSPLPSLAPPSPSLWAPLRSSLSETFGADGTGAYVASRAVLEGAARELVSCSVQGGEREEVGAWMRVLGRALKIVWVLSLTDTLRGKLM